MANGLRISPDLELPRDAVTATLVVYGGKGMGKTNFGGVLVEELTKAHLRWAVLDPLGVWYGLRHSKDGRSAGIECLILGGMHGDIPIEPTGGAVIADLVVEEAVNVIIDFSRKPSGQMWSIGEKIRFVTDYTLRLFQRQGEIVDGRRHDAFMQILDEAARYIPQVIPSGAIDVAKCVGAWEQLVEEGRNVGIGVGLLTQRSARMNKSVSELADAMIAFRIVGPRSIEAVTDWLGEHIEKTRLREMVEMIRRLDRGDALVVSPGWLKFEKVAHIRVRETFDSSATPKPGERRHEPKRAAKPDLEKYKTRMAETIERAAQDDPRALRAENARLKKELAKGGARFAASNEVAKQAPAVDQAAIREAISKAVADERAAWVTEMAYYREQVQKQFVQVLAKLKRSLGTALESLDTIDVEKLMPPAPTGPLKRRGTGALRYEVQPAVTVHSNGQPLKRETAKALGTLARAAARHINDASAADAGAPIPKGEKAVLAAIAQYPNGVQRTQLTVLTGYKKTSRDTYIGRLRERGYIDVVAGGQIVASEAGIAALGSDYEPPLTGEARREKYLRELPAGESKILRIAIESPHAWVAREVISEETGYKKTSRDTYIARLRARELIEIGREGISASEDLF